MKEVVSWSPEEVTNWLMENAVPEYCEPLKSFTGQDLINLTEEDFKKTPLSRVSSDSGQQLLHMIETLKMAHHIEAHKNGHVNGHIHVSVNNTAHENGFSSKTKLNGVPNGTTKPRGVPRRAPRGPQAAVRGPPRRQGPPGAPRPALPT